MEIAKDQKRETLIQLLVEFEEMVAVDVVTADDADALEACGVLLKYLREEYLGEGTYASAEEMFGGKSE